MILKKTVALDEKETGGSLFDKLSAAGAELLVETLDAMNAGTVQYEKQPEESPTPYASMLRKEDGRMDWTKSARELECLIRGLNPWPSAYTTYRGKTLKLWAAHVEQHPDTAQDYSDGTGFPVQPGAAAQVTKTELKIQTGNGLLVIEELQPEGKKRMACDAFLRGYPVEAGEVFGRE